MKSDRLVQAMGLTRRLAGALVVAVAATFLAAIGGCETITMAGSTAPNTPLVTLAAADAGGLNIRWSSLIGLSPSAHEKVTGVYRTKTNVYIMTNKNQVVALNAASGEKLWNTDFDEPGVRLFPPVEIDFHNQPGLVIYTRLHFYVVDRLNGEILARSALPYAAATPAVAVGNVLCLGSEHDFFYGAWVDLLGNDKWHVRVENDTFASQPVTTSEGNVVFSSVKGVIWKVSVDEGKSGWTKKTTGEVVGGLAADSRAVYVPCLDHKLYAFELFSSHQLWAAPLDGRLDQTPVVAGANVLAVGTGSGLYASDIAKGDRRWFIPGVRQILSRSADHVYAADNAGNILSIALDTGTVDSTTPVNNGPVFATNTVDGTIYGVTQDGGVCALEPAPR